MLIPRCCPEFGHCAECAPVLWAWPDKDPVIAITQIPNNPCSYQYMLVKEASEVEEFALSLRNQAVLNARTIYLVYDGDRDLRDSLFRKYDEEGDNATTPQRRHLVMARLVETGRAVPYVTHLKRFPTL